MMPIVVLLRLLFWLGVATGTAHAQLSSTISAVGGGPVAGNLIGSFAGEGIATTIINIIWMVVLAIGIFLVVRAGISLIVSQEEDKLSKAKTTIACTLVGIVLIYISQELVLAFIPAPHPAYTANTQGIFGGGQVNLQVTLYGILNWILVVVAALGSLMIVVSVLRGIASFGKEESVKNMRQTVFGVAIGILLISLIPAIKFTLGITDLAPLGEAGTTPVAIGIVGTVANIVGDLLLFLALLAISIVIYAGVRIIVNFGNEEEFTKSRQLIIRALIGLLIILLSYAITVFVIELVVP